MPLVTWIVLGGTAYAGSRLWSHLKQGSDATAPRHDVDDQRPEHDGQPASRRRVSLLSRSRRELLDELRDARGSETADQPRERRDAEVRHNLQVSSASLGLVLGSYALPALSLAAAPLMIYGAGRMVLLAVHDWRHGGAKAMATLDAVAMVGSTVVGPWIAPATIYFTCSVARKLLALTEDSSSGQILELFETRTHQVWRLRGDLEEATLLEEVEPGDVLVARAGEVIPVDGTVVDGVARIDQQALTGESQPSEKTPGDRVLAASMVLEGRLHIRVEHAGAHTLAARMVDVVNRSRSLSDESWSRGQRIMEQVAAPTLGLGLVTTLGLGLYRGLGVLETSFGASMRYSAPIAALNYLQIASEMRILVKDGRALERLSEVDVVVFDKTGTLTMDRPAVSAIEVMAGYDEETALRLAAGAEHRQTHPIALALRAAATARGLTIPEPTHTAVRLGRGLAVQIEGHSVLVGSAILLGEEDVPVPAPLAERSGSRVFVAVDGVLVASIELHARVRPEVPQLVHTLRERGLELAIISGDRRDVTEDLARRVGIETVHAEVLPDGKAAILEDIRSSGRSVCFIGDGINDALALRAADVSVSMAGATTVAIDSASIVMMDGGLGGLSQLFELADEYDRNLKASMALTFVPGSVALVGIYAFGHGILFASALATASVGLGVVNGMMPGLKLREFAPRPPVAQTSDVQGA